MTPEEHPQQSTIEDTSAAAIVKELAEWSLKYPRSRIYSAYCKPEMDGELIALEENAKHWLIKNSRS